MVRLITAAGVVETNTCPNCQSDWNGEDIFTVLRKQAWCANKNDDELREFVKSSYSPPYIFQRVIGIQYAYGDYRHRDGVSAWQCPDCSHTFPRDLGKWSLKPSEVQCEKTST